MNRETIEKEADKYSYEQWKVEDDFYCRDCMGIIAPPAFVAGAEWRINSVWHSPNELPRIGSYVVVLYEDEHIFFGKVRDYCNSVPVKTWAYLDDLLPDGKEGRNE